MTHLVFILAFLQPTHKPMVVSLTPAETTTISALYSLEARVEAELATVRSLSATTSDPLFGLYDVAWNEATFAQMRRQQDINAFKSGLSNEYVLTNHPGVLRPGWTKNCFAFDASYTHITECP